LTFGEKIDTFEIMKSQKEIVTETLENLLGMVTEENQGYVFVVLYLAFNLGIINLEEMDEWNERITEKFN